MYLAGLGPSFETPAEIRAFRVMGADVVGMSTVPEVIAARHVDMKVSAIGVVVNHAAGMTDKHITHDETLHFADVASTNLTNLVETYVVCSSVYHSHSNTTPQHHTGIWRRTTSRVKGFKYIYSGDNESRCTCFVE